MSDHRAEAFPAAQGVRSEWETLPAEVRTGIEVELAASVVSATTHRGGFSPGVASSLELSDGRRVFVKVADPAQNPGTPLLHLREAEYTRQLPGGVSAPRLLASAQIAGHVVLCLEHVDGRQPSLPWQQDDVRRAVRAIEELSRQLTPAPFAAPTLVESLATAFCGFRTLHDLGEVALDPWVVSRLAELAAIEATWEQHAVGETLLHCDLRADNMLLTQERVVFLDWPHVCIGPAWFDLLAFLPSMQMQGGPMAADVFPSSSLAADAPDAAVTAALTALTGYFLHGALQPAPPGLPTLRAFQAAQGDAALTWLRQRIP